MQYKWFVLPAIGIIVLVLGFMLFGGLGDNLIYYLTPTEAVEQQADFPNGERFEAHFDGNLPLLAVAPPVSFGNHKGRAAESGSKDRNFMLVHKFDVALK